MMTKNILRFGILLNIVAFSSLFYWNNELQKEVIKIENKIEKIQKQEPSEEQVLESFLKKYKRKWSLEDKQTFLKTIKVAEKFYYIDKYDLMTFVALESNYTIRALSKPNRNGTRDAGLTQQNSDYYKARYRRVAKVAKAYGLKYDINNKFDIALNVLSCAYFVNSLKIEIKKKYNATDHFQVVASYNTGIKGFFKNRKIAKQYYSVFQQLKSVVHNA